jgi:hypothetical protein
MHRGPGPLQEAIGARRSSSNLPPLFLSFHLYTIYALHYTCEKAIRKDNTPSLRYMTLRM